MEIEKSSITENQFGFNEILQHVNDLSYRMNLNAVLIKAEGIWRKLKEAEENSERVCTVSNAARRILGMNLVDHAANLTNSDDANMDI